MKRLFYLSALAFGLFTTAIAQTNIHAQTVIIERSGAHYTGYGRGYYGSYGQNYYGQGRSYGGRPHTYSGYGNGPYGYDSGSTYQFRSHGGYGYGGRNYYNGYGNSGYYDRSYAPVYRPFGFGVYSSFDNRW